MEPMKQQCYLINVWFTWLGIPAMAIAMGMVAGWWACPAILLAGYIAQTSYIRVFPKMSRWLGYGSVEDISAGPPKRSMAGTQVILYTANVCPFCPLVRQRLGELQRSLGFDLAEVDITFQPALIKAKGVRSVPVIEAGGRLWVGNATSAQLASFLTGAQ